MTSDRPAVSRARKLLDYAIGSNRVSLAKLKDNELRALLQERLSGIDTRRLRGFKPLEDFLRRRIGGMRLAPVWTDYAISVSTNVIFEFDPKGLAQEIDLKSHVLSLSRHALAGPVTFKRIESGEETEDWKVADSWGKDKVIVTKVLEWDLLLHRDPDAGAVYDHLFDIRYVCEKIPHQDKMLVMHIKMTHVPLNELRSFYGENHSAIVRDLIWEMGSVLSRTADALHSESENFRQLEKVVDRLGESIME